MSNPIGYVDRTLSRVALQVAFPTKCDYVKPMLRIVSVMMVIFFRRFRTIKARESACPSKSSSFNGMIHNSFRFCVGWISRSFAIRNPSLPFVITFSRMRFSHSLFGLVGMGLAIKCRFLALPGFLYFHSSARETSATIGVLWSSVLGEFQSFFPLKTSAAPAFTIVFMRKIFLNGNPASFCGQFRGTFGCLGHD